MIKTFISLVILADCIQKSISTVRRMQQGKWGRDAMFLKTFTYNGNEFTVRKDKKNIYFLNNSFD
jgi:hypothetical protein